MCVLHFVYISSSQVDSTQLFYLSGKLSYWSTVYINSLLESLILKHSHSHQILSFTFQTSALEYHSVAETMAPTETAPKQYVSPQPPAIPSGSPTSPPFPQSVTVNDLKRLVVGFIKEAQKAESTVKVQALASVAEKHVPPVGSGARASRLEYKTVDERYFPSL